MRYELSDWGQLLTLTVLWGSAFLFTKIAVGAIPPQLVVAGRLTIASLLLVPLALALRRKLPPDVRLWSYLLLIALFGNLLPFLLITWGQKFIDSGLTGILFAITPLATLSMSHYLIPGERMTHFRIGGFLFGFAGVVALMGPEALVVLVDGTGDLIPMLAVVGGATCYAISAILARLRPPSDTVSSAAATTLLAALVIAPFALVAGGAEVAPRPSILELMSVAVLGVFCTAFAAILYFRLVTSVGPAFVSQINYLLPLWAVFVGVLFLDEILATNHILALGLILGGILLTQLERRRSG
jgi:drug/metabolite transporter (DMT)-like permease